MTATARPSRLITPSPIFLALVTATVVVGALLSRNNDLGGYGVFVFVVVGWIVALSLHEFGHAIVAYIGGDRSVVAKGYLTLDVRKYADLGTSLLLPVFILIIGGIGLPGGAVWINTGAIRSPVMRSLMSFAGPAMSGLCAALCLVPIRMGLIESDLLVTALGFLGWIQVIAMIFNLLPVPGLDGFGVIEPHLSRQALRSIAPYRQYGIILVFLAIFFVPTARDGFFDITNWATEALGGPDTFAARARGWFAFRFWE